jgi:hypothetical protein
VSLLSHDRYQYDSLILSKQTWAYPRQHLQQLLSYQGRWPVADVTKECLEKILIFPLRYYANCVSNTLKVLITFKVYISFIITLYHCVCVCVCVCARVCVCQVTSTCLTTCSITGNCSMHYEPNTISVKLNYFIVTSYLTGKKWVNCTVLTGNSAGLKSVLNCRLPHRTAQFTQGILQIPQFTCRHRDVTCTRIHTDLTKKTWKQW